MDPSQWAGSQTSQSGVVSLDPGQFILFHDGSVWENLTPRSVTRKVEVYIVTGAEEWVSNGYNTRERMVRMTGRGTDGRTN